MYTGKHHTGREPQRLAQTLSLVASQLVFGPRNRPPGVFGPIAQSVGPLKVLGVLLILVVGPLVDLS